METKERTKGVLAYWNMKRGYGVIHTEPGEFGIWTDLFLHVSNIISGSPIVGSVAEFSIGVSAGRKLLPALECKLSPKIARPDFPNLDSGRQALAMAVKS